ncbi:MAG: GxxExxY protein [Pontiellaceae bacterium]|nr:GxxExxY protein [Pontiellaceae bacterium]
MMKKQIQNADVLYPDLSYSIIGAAMDVHNGLGPGWDYHRAMIEALCTRGHEAVNHDRKTLLYRGTVVDHFELDLLIDDLIILELKHIKSDFHPEHITQIINYLKRWGKRLGILINFGLERLRFQRVPFSPVSGRIKSVGNWDCTELSNGQAVAAVMECILGEHGLGYSAGVYRKLLFAELKHQGVEVIFPVISPHFGGLCLGERAVDAIRIGGDFMVLVSASSDGTSAEDLWCLKSYMKQASVPCGVLVHIGDSEIQLRGVR